MQINFNDSIYRADNGRSPKGHGLWEFKYNGRGFWHIGTLTEAKAACREDVCNRVPQGFNGVITVNIIHKDNRW